MSTTTKFDATQEALGICVVTKTPVFLWGPPGGGKTSVVQSIVDAIRRQNGWTPDEFPFETIIASVHDPADFGGYPAPDLDAQMVRRLPIDWAKRVAGKNGLVFLDEFSTAPPAVQAANLRVIEERVVGPLDLGTKVSFVLAGNPLDSAAGGWEFAPATSRRFVHLDWEPDADYIINGFLTGFPEVKVPDLASIEVTEDDLNEFTKLRRGYRIDPEARGLVAGFLAANRTAVSQVPTDPAKASRAWPNPAAWERVMLLLTAVKQAGASDTARDLLVYGSVGDAVGPEFVQYATMSDLPNTEDLLDDPSSFSFADVTGDKVFVILGSVISAVLANNTLDRWTAAWEITGNAADQHSIGTAAMAARLLASNQPDLGGKEPPIPPQVKVFIPMLREAGLLTS